jgi:hypothetical protein
MREKKRIRLAGRLPTQHPTEKDLVKMQEQYDLIKERDMPKETRALVDRIAHQLGLK